MVTPNGVAPHRIESIDEALVELTYRRVACLGAGSGLRNCDRLGNDEERQANLAPILEKASNSQTRKRRRELDRRSSVPRGLEPALPEYE